jgi:hypothetical protein
MTSFEIIFLLKKRRYVTEESDFILGFTHRFMWLMNKMINYFLGKM